MGYLDLAGYKARSVIPPSDVDGVEARRPGFTLARLAANQSILDSRLRKRYAAPFTGTIPEIVLSWLVAMTNVDVMRARGVNPQDPQIEGIVKDRDDAIAQIKEAADSKDGLFDLPIAEGNQVSAVSQGFPLGYGETSPYAWTDVEVQAAVGDDSRGRGL